MRLHDETGRSPSRTIRRRGRTEERNEKERGYTNNVDMQVCGDTNMCIGAMLEAANGQIEDQHHRSKSQHVRNKTSKLSHTPLLSIMDLVFFIPLRSVFVFDSCSFWCISQWLLRSLRRRFELGRSRSTNSCGEETAQQEYTHMSPIPAFDVVTLPPFPTFVFLCRSVGESL